MSSVIKGAYDFTLSYASCKSLVYKDESVWMVGPQFTAPTSYTIGIKFPGGAEQDTTVLVGAANKLLPETFGFDKFPSGMYCFTAKAGQGVGGKSYIRYVAVLCAEECGLQQAIARLVPGKFDKVIARVQDYLNRAKIAAERQDVGLMQDYVEFIRDDLKTLNCSC